MKRSRLARVPSKRTDITEIEHGDMVAYMAADGNVYTGKAVMHSSIIGSWVLNTGGRYGTPAIVSPKNFVSIIRKGR